MDGIEVFALVAILAGSVLFVTAEVALLGATLVAGGAYGLILPEFVRSRGPASG